MAQVEGLPRPKLGKPQMVSATFIQTHTIHSQGQDIPSSFEQSSKRLSFFAPGRFDHETHDRLAMHTILPRRTGPKLLFAAFLLCALIYLTTFTSKLDGYGRHRSQRHLQPEKKEASHDLTGKTDVQRPRPAPILAQEQPKQQLKNAPGVAGNAQAVNLLAQYHADQANRHSTGRPSAGHDSSWEEYLISQVEKGGQARTSGEPGDVTSIDEDLEALEAASNGLGIPVKSHNGANKNKEASKASQHTTSDTSTHEAIAPPASIEAPKDTRVADDYIPHFKNVIKLPGLTVEEARLGCQWPDKAPVNFQYGSSTDWVKNVRNDTEIEAHRQEWQHFILDSVIPYNKIASNISGRGIVICAGNERSLKRLHVLLRLLAHFDTTLPVEIHYWTTREISDRNRTSLSTAYPPGVTFNDLSSPDQVFSTTANGFINYNLKLAALLNTRFAEPLLLDSDNLPVSDPSTLYDSTTYKSHGTIFWPDIARTRPQNPIWAVANTPCRTDEYEQESGQLLVDKRRFWYHLQLAAWFGHQSYYQEFLLGDKDCFRFAWHALRTPYGMPRRWLASVGMVQRPADLPAFPAGANETSASHAIKADSDNQKSETSEEQKRDQLAQGGARSLYCGHSFGQHHPDSTTSPILFLHGGLVKTLNPEQIAHARIHSGGFLSAYKRSEKADSDKGAVEAVDIKYDGGLDYLGDEVLGLRSEEKDGEEGKGLKYFAQCVDMKDVRPRALGDEETKEMRGLEAVFEKAGGFWMLDDD